MISPVASKPAEFLVRYCEQVLGLKALPRKILLRPRVVILDIPWPEGLHSDDMFQKMMAALDLKSQSYEVIEFLPAEIGSHLSRLESRQEVLCFSNELADVVEKALASTPGLSFRLTRALGPRDLRHEPEKKRETWEHLKALKARLPS